MNRDIARITKRLVQYRGGSDDTSARILQEFLDHLPDDGKANLIRKLDGFTSDDKFIGYANVLRTNLLIPMRANSGTPSISSVNSSISQPTTPDDNIEAVSSALDKPMRREKRMKKECLIRDGWRCTITGRADKKHKDKVDGSKLFCNSECVHIIPFSLSCWKDEAERQSKCSIWETLIACFPSLDEKLKFKHESVNDTRNGITMTREVHPDFGHFNLAFEETETVNTYVFKNYALDTTLVRLPPQVTFVAHDGRYELPSPDLLAIHATLAKILHATGEAEAIDKLMDDFDDTMVLSRDGSTDLARLLDATPLGPLSSRPSPEPNVPRRSPESEVKPRPYDSSEQYGRSKENARG